MRPKITNHNQGRLFESRLSQILSPNNNLRILGELIDWQSLEKELTPFFANKGAPGLPVRLVTGVFMLQHMSGLSDEQVIRAWVENPYWQYFCGFDYLQWTFPMNASSLSRWRKRLGVEGMKKIIAATLKTALEIGAVRPSSLENVIVDTTVMPKNIAYPTDARLYYKGLRALVREAKTWNLPLRQTYTFLSRHALRKACRYAHARQMKRARRETKRLHTYLGRVRRDLERQIIDKPILQKQLTELMDVTDKLLSQKRGDSNKVYSVHEPSVECISKGKAHKKYEFGCKVSIVITHREGWALHVGAYHGNPYDGHTLAESLEQAEAISKTKIKRGYVDKGYRGHSLKGVEVYINGSKGLSRHFKKLLRRRQAIEPQIGHMKSEGKLERNYLKGLLGDKINAILCGIGHNIRMLIRNIELQSL